MSKDKKINREDAWNELGIRILTAARQELYLSMRYLYLALNSMKFQKYSKTFLTGCDGETIYFNPMKLSMLYKEHPVLVNRCYLHMILHCIFRHNYNAAKVENEQLWNIACDIAVEFLIDDMSYSAVKTIIPESRKKLYEQMNKSFPIFSAENIYQFLLNTTEKSQYEYEKLFLVDDHSFWYANAKKDSDDNQGESEEEEQKENHNDSDKNRESQEKEHLQNILEQSSQNGQMKWEDISERLQSELSSFGNPGTQSGELVRNLTVTNTQRMSYGEFLKKFAVYKETMQMDMDSFDFGFYHYGMELYGNMPLLEELEFKEEKRIEEFVIVLDTSGSCSGEEINRFLDETYQILSEKESFFKKIQLHIIQADNRIQSDICIQTLDELEIYKNNFEVKGFGGTDFRPAFAYVDTLIKEKKLSQLNGLIYFTDGYGIYPEKSPRYKTAFVFVHTKGDGRKVPPWAIKLELI